MTSETVETIFGFDEGPTKEKCWEMYEKCRSFNEAISLDDTVSTNENFFIGKQWEGVQANGLPTPVFNILKRDVCFVVSSITSDNLTVQATPMTSAGVLENVRSEAAVINQELARIMERNNITGIIRQFARDAAVRGDGCLYTYWDTKGRGEIKTEILENTRVYFGNPNDRTVDNQPFIIIESRSIARDVRKKAKANGISDWQSITADEDRSLSDNEKKTDDKVTLLLMLWKDEKTGEVQGFEFTKKCVVRPQWSLGLRYYPIVWLNWDYVADCYHGQAMITGLIPNQIFINKAWAMSILSLMTSAYPKVIYDKTRIPKWDNRVGAAIGVNGGDMNAAARIMDPAQISPQIAQFIELAVDQTNRNLGATSTALGDTKPDNTSAIIAMQKAAATPSEITKQNLRNAIEELARIYIEFMTVYYGKRLAYVLDNFQVIDCSKFRDVPFTMKIDVGASSYYSEIASIQTLDNLLQQGRITTEQYLERIPDGYIPDRQGLLNSLKLGKVKEGV
jgi:hypothetical protein